MSKIRQVTLSVGILCGASALVACTRSRPGLHALPAPTHAATNVLLKRTASWNDVPYRDYPRGQPQLTTLKITIPAHSSLPWHTHEVPNAAYLLSGHLTVEERDTGRTATYQAGEAFAESVGNVHRGFTDSEPAVVIVTYAGTAVQPLSVPISVQHD